MIYICSVHFSRPHLFSHTLETIWHRWDVEICGESHENHTWNHEIATWISWIWVNHTVVTTWSSRYDLEQHQLRIWWTVNTIHQALNQDESLVDQELLPRLHQEQGVGDFSSADRWWAKLPLLFCLGRGFDNLIMLHTNQRWNMLQLVWGMAHCQLCHEGLSTSNENDKCMAPRYCQKLAGRCSQRHGV